MKLNCAYLSYGKQARIQNWDKAKLYIISTIPTYVEKLSLDQKDLIDPIMIELIDNKLSLRNKTDFINLIKNILKDDELEKPLEYLLFNSSIHLE